MGYHLREIPRGKFGEASKIVEEFQEWEDAREQGVVVMELVELSDLLGAIEGYIQTKGLTLADLLAMKDVTRRAFLDGTREAREASLVTADPYSVIRLCDCGSGAPNCFCNKSYSGYRPTPPGVFT